MNKLEKEKYYYKILKIYPLPPISYFCVLIISHVPSSVQVTVDPISYLMELTTFGGYRRLDYKAIPIDFFPYYK